MRVAAVPSSLEFMFAPSASAQCIVRTQQGTMCLGVCLDQFLVACIFRKRSKHNRTMRPSCGHLLVDRRIQLIGPIEAILTRS